jgi:arylsulfatase A-like enzyme
MKRAKRPTALPPWLAPALVAVGLVAFTSWAWPPRDEPDTMTRIRAGYHANPQFPVGKFNPKMWQALRWGYYRLVEKVDAEIGKVLDALQAAGLEENTLIVFTADHGECAGAHGFNQKTVFLEE